MSRIALVPAYEIHKDLYGLLLRAYHHWPLLPTGTYMIASEPDERTPSSETEFDVWPWLLELLNPRDFPLFVGVVAEWPEFPTEWDDIGGNDRSRLMSRLLQRLLRDDAVAWLNSWYTRLEDFRGASHLSRFARLHPETLPEQGALVRLAIRSDEGDWAWPKDQRMAGWRLATRKEIDEAAANPLGIDALIDWTFGSSGAVIKSSGIELTRKLIEAPKVDRASSEEWLREVLCYRVFSLGREWDYVAILTPRALVDELYDACRNLDESLGGTRSP